MKAILTVAVLIVMMAMAGTAAAAVETGWPMDTPNTYAGQHVMIDFEDGMPNYALITSTFDGIEFVTMDNRPWMYAVRGSDMHIYPNTNYYIVNGDAGAWCDTPGNRGMITFANDVGHVSVLVSTWSGVEIDAYNRSGALIANSGRADGNTGTLTFTRLSVDRNETDIAYVIIHDSGNYWLIDDLIVSQTATISIGDVFNNDTEPIMVRWAENAGACDVTLSYDSSIVTVTSVTGGDMNMDVNLEHVSEGWIRIVAYGDALEGLSGEFTLADVTFERVSDGVCPLEISVTTFKDATPAGNSMPYYVSNGTYSSYHNGDVNGDGVVDMNDVMYLAKNVLGITGFGNIIEVTADVDGDGIIDIADASYLAKHILDIHGFEELK